MGCQSSHLDNIDVLWQVNNIMVQAQNDDSRKLLVIPDLIPESSRALLYFDRASVLGKRQKSKRALRAVIASAKIRAKTQA
jgi:hypothetical protein